MKKMILLSFSIVFLFTMKASAFHTSATTSILMDMDSGRILYGNQIHTVRSVASISKIMTAILAIESGKMEQTVVIGEEILSAYGSGIYIQPTEEIKLQDLVYGLMLRSGNDAALAIAHYVGSSVDQFVKKMNEKATAIGMTHTTFYNPSGLDEKDGNFSTAHDMAVLTSYAMKNELYREIVSTKTHNIKTNLNVYHWTNKNKLLFNYPYTTGGKTGFTEKARRTLVTTAKKENMNLVAVTLNDGNDFEDHVSLFEEAFSTYRNYRILREGTIQVLEDSYYPKGSLILKNDFHYPLNDQEKNTILLKIELEKKRSLSEEEVGKVIVLIGDKTVHEERIFYQQINQPKKTWWQRVIFWFKNL